MAFKFLQKLFGRKKNESIVLTADEAFKTLEPSVPATEAEIPVPAAEAEIAVPEAEAEIPVPEAETPAPEAAQTAPEEPALEPEPCVEEPEPCVEEPEPVRMPDYYAWMYACLDDPSCASAGMRPQLISSLRSLTEDESGICGTLSTGASVFIRVRTDKTDVTEQAGYLKLQYADTYLTDRDVQNAAFMQIELFNVLIEFRMEAPYTPEDEEALRKAVFAAAHPLRGFVVNMKFDLARWDEKLVIATDGRTDFTLFMPIRLSPTQAGESDSAADAARMKRSNEILKSHGVSVECTLPVQAREYNARLRTPEEIINRLAAVFACALKAQAYASPREVPAPAAWSISAIKRLDAQYGVNRLFTVKEIEYIVRSSDSQHEGYRLRFESCAVLLWALGLMRLDWPDARFDSSAILSVIRDADTDMLLRIAKPRPLGEILNMHDLTFRQHCLCVREEEEAVRNAHIDHDVVYERHYALNWLLAVDGISDWDMIVPKT